MNRRSAEIVVASRTFPSEEGLADSALLLAIAGFEALEPSELKELRDLFTQVYGGITSVDRQWMSTYMDKMRGATLTPDESRRGRALLTVGVQKLPEAKRVRLQNLLEQAITSGLKRRREGEQRQRDAEVLAAANESVAQPAASAAPAPFAAPATDPVSPEAPAAPDAREGAAGTTSPTREMTTASGRGESYWRSRAQGLRASFEEEARRAGALPGWTR